MYTIHSTTPQETSYTSNFLLFSFQFKLPSNWLCTRIFIKGKGYKSSNCFKRVQILIKTTNFSKNIICILGNIHTVLFDDGFILFLKVWKIYVEADFNFEPWCRISEGGSWLGHSDVTWYKCFKCGTDCWTHTHV